MFVLFFEKKKNEFSKTNAPEAMQSVVGNRVLRNAHCISSVTKCAIAYLLAGSVHHFLNFAGALEVQQISHILLIAPFIINALHVCLFLICLIRPHRYERYMEVFIIPGYHYCTSSFR